MTVTVLKSSFLKLKPKTVYYRCYKTFNCNDFRKELIVALTSVSNYGEFQTIYLKILDKHAPMKMKSVRANQAPYMTKALRKAIMTRSSLKNKLYKNFTHENNRAFKKQRNFCSRLYKKERKKYYENLNVKNITDNKLFWKTVKPFLSEKGNPSLKITLVEGEVIISEDQEVAQKLNEFFSNSVRLLDIPTNSYITNPTDDCLIDPIEIAIQKFDSHPSVLKIREQAQNLCFNFHPMSLKEIEKEISYLNSKKSNTFNSIHIISILQEKLSIIYFVI